MGGEAVRLTDKAAARYKPQARRRDVKDSVAQGLYLRIEPTGVRTWYYRYRTPGRKTSRLMRLGEFPEICVSDARGLAAQHRQTVKAGGDPGAYAQAKRAENRRMPTVEDFARADYIERYAKPNKKSWLVDKQLLEQWVIPSIGRLKLGEVRPPDVVAILDACHDAGHTRQPGKVLAVTRRMFWFAVKRKLLEASPAQGVSEKQPEPKNRNMKAPIVRQWWMLTGEIIDAADSAPGHKAAALALRLLLLTGQRPGEVAGLRLDELDLEHEAGPLWTIPGERRKFGKPHAVALTPDALAVVEKAKEQVAANGFLFPNKAGGGCRVDSGLNRILRLVFPVGEAPTPHAARHTVATGLDGLEFAEDEIARVLGHQSTTVTGRFYVNRRSVGMQRRALEAWESKLREILGEGAQTGNVVAIGGPA